jgi:hypothetical protein
MAIDLSKCTKGQKLLSSHGETLTYVKPLPEDNYYDHLIEYSNGSSGSRTNEGYVYRNNRKPEFDDDIIEILDS